MSGFAKIKALKRFTLAHGPARAVAKRHAGVEESGVMNRAAAESRRIVPKADYGIAPLTDEEVRRLPVAHQYSS